MTILLLYSHKPVYPYSRGSQNLHSVFPVIKNIFFPLLRLSGQGLTCILTNDLVKLCNLAKQVSIQQHRPSPST